AITKNPKAFADFTWFLVRIVSLSLNAIGWLTQVADYIEQHFVPAFEDAGRQIKQWALDAWGWIDNYFLRPFAIGLSTMKRWVGDAVNDMAKSWDIFVQGVAIGWDGIELTFLKGVRFIVGLMAHLPGPLGAPFRQWKDDLGGVMAGIQADIARRTGQIQADI